MSPSRQEVEGAPPQHELAVVMPCLNEARTVVSCIRKAQSFFERAGVSGEVIVADNGSEDASQTLAADAGARVVVVPQRGYGAALRTGVEASSSQFVVMGDSDDSYDFATLDPFLDRLRAGDDLVVGNRYRGGITPGAMPWIHRYIGNPVLSLFARLFFRVPLRDVYCGLRGLRRSAFDRLDLQSPGMEFALEMVVKARLLNMRVSEVPTTLAPDGRGRPPHLNTWRDGRRSLLLYLSILPQFLFYPGLLLMIAGLALGTVLTLTPVEVLGAHLDIHTLLYCGAAVLVGFQGVAYSIALRFLMIEMRLAPPHGRFATWMAAVRLEHGVGLGLVLSLAGLAGVLWIFRLWEANAFGDLDPFLTMRVAIPSAIGITLGGQVALTSLFLSLTVWQVRGRTRNSQGPF
jgi:glycosyltransferase involved in cell wall biosynthesis